MSSRDLFSELSSALAEAREHSEGKLTLRSHQVEDKGELSISPDEIVGIRETFNMSRGVFARLLHTSARTLESWEQGRSVPMARPLPYSGLCNVIPRLFRILRVFDQGKDWDSMPAN